MHRFSSAATLLQSTAPTTATELEALTAALPRPVRYGLADLVPGAAAARLVKIEGSVHLGGSLHWDDSADARDGDGSAVDLLVVNGDLELDGDLVNREGDYGPGLLVLGSVRARNVVHGGAVWVIGGNLEARGVVVGHYNHGQLHIGGRLAAALLVTSDHHLEVHGECAAPDADDAIAGNRVFAEVLDYRNDRLEIAVDALLDRLLQGQPVLRDPTAPPTVLDAVLRGELAMLNTALAAGGDPDAPGVDGLTALLMAADQGREDLLARLLQAGASIAARGHDGWTALHYASAANAAGCIGRLLDAGAEVDAIDDRGHTPLHGAISHNRGAAARLLLARGAALAWPRHEARTLFTRCFTAPYNGYGEIDEALILDLLDRGLDVGLDDGPAWPEPLLQTAESGSPRLLQRLLQPSATPPQRRLGALTLTPLHQAAMSARVDNLHLLLQQPWAPAVLGSDEAGLLVALALQGPALRERLGKPGAAPRRLLPGPLPDERLATLDLLLSAGVSPAGTVRGLPLGALSADPRVLARLLDAGAAVDAVDAEGASLLFLVICHAPPDVDVALVTLLLEHGADPTAPAPGHGSRDIAHAVAAGGDLDMLAAVLAALHRRGAGAPIPALLDIAFAARERNRAVIVLDAVLRQADAQQLAPLHELLRERPRLHGDDRHLAADQDAIRASLDRVLARWPTLRPRAEEAQQALAAQREEDGHRLAALRKAYARS